MDEHRRKQTNIGEHGYTRMGAYENRKPHDSAPLERSFLMRSVPTKNSVRRPVGTGCHSCSQDGRRSWSRHNYTCNKTWSTTLYITSSERASRTDDKGWSSGL